MARRFWADDQPPNIPAPRLIEPMLTPQAKEMWYGIGPTWRSALMRIRQNAAKRGNELSMQTLMDLWIWQCPADDYVALCAATGTRFEPRGFLLPTLMRWKRTGGLESGNMGLVVKGYAELRFRHGVYGVQGHLDIIDWMRGVVAFHDANPGRDLRAPFDPVLMGQPVPRTTPLVDEATGEPLVPFEAEESS